MKKIDKAIARNSGTDLINNLFLGNNSKKVRKTNRKTFGISRREQKKGKAKCKTYKGGYISRWESLKILRDLYIPLC